MVKDGTYRASHASHARADREHALLRRRTTTTNRTGAWLAPLTAIAVVVGGCGAPVDELAIGDGDATPTAPPEASTGPDAPPADGDAEPAGVPTPDLDTVLDQLPCSLVEPIAATDHRSEVERTVGDLVASGVADDAGLSPLIARIEDDVAVVAARRVADTYGARETAIWLVQDLDGAPTVTAVADTLAPEVSRFPTTEQDPAGSDLLARARAWAEDCAAVSDVFFQPPVVEPEPSMAPDLIVLEPTAAAPGDLVAVRFPQETMRGVAFQLDRRTDDGWETVAWLTSDANGGEPSGVLVADAEGYAWPDVGIGGPGPDRLRIPDGVAPGPHRICTANAGEDVCAPIELTD